MTIQDPKKPDFSNVTSGESPQGGSPDFSNVLSGSSSSAPSPIGGAAAGKTERMYVVVRGDSLSKISKTFYGNANSWKRIFEANRDVIDDPDMIQPGWRLRIPE